MRQINALKKGFPECNIYLVFLLFLTGHSLNALLVILLTDNKFKLPRLEGEATASVV